MSNGDNPWKDLVGSVSSLNSKRVKTVVSVPLPKGPNSSLATLYAELDNRAASPVAVRLESELLGTRQLIGTAAIPPGFAGIAAIATGVVADAWHGSAHGTLQEASLTLKLGVRPCCSGFRVVVPSALTTRLTPRLKSAVPTSHSPLEREAGSYNCLYGTEGTETIAATERITRVYAVATSDGPGGSLSGLGLEIIHWPAGQPAEWWPKGNAEGPRSLTFAGTAFYIVELVN